MKVFIARYRMAVDKELAWLMEAAEAGRVNLYQDYLRTTAPRAKVGYRTRITHVENLTLGTHVSIGEQCYLMSRGGITLGDFCNIANNTIMTTVSHHVDGGLYYENDYTAPITLGSNVWVGSNAIILPGVTIGDNAIVGAGAVVTTSIEANQIAVGVPARIMKDVPIDREKRTTQVNTILGLDDSSLSE